MQLRLVKLDIHCWYCRLKVTAPPIYNMFNPVTRLVNKHKFCVLFRAVNRHRRTFHTSFPGWCYDEHKTNPDVAPSAIHNVQSIKAKWVEHFTFKNIPEPEASAELIIAHVLGKKTVLFQHISCFKSILLVWCGTLYCHCFIFVVKPWKCAKLLVQ